MLRESPEGWHQAFALYFDDDTLKRYRRQMMWSGSRFIGSAREASLQEFKSNHRALWWLNV